jgi:hypothetical protein
MVFVRNGGVWTQQGNKLVGTGATGSASQGQSVGLTADGNTVFVGGSNDNSSTGAVWVYSRSGGTWTQQGSKLVAPGLTPSTYFGRTVASSADGNTIIIGGYGDNSQLGAAWIYTRTGATWIQQGNKLVGTGAVGSSRQGGGVAISADGNTTVVAGPCDNSASGSGGAFWVYTRTGTSWTQQGNKLVVTGVVGNSGQGGAIALSADGNNLIMGGPYDDSYNGATWLFTRAGGFWTQKGSKLVGTGAIGDGHGQGSYQGVAVAISADGSTAIVGGETDNSTVGATWVFAPCSSTASANAISLSSAAGTDGQSICTNAAINTVTYQTTGAIGANESGLPAGVTGSWASNVATISGTPTASGTFNYSVTLIGGCGGAVTKMGTIKVAPCVTGLNQIDDPRTEVKISPNPSDGSFSIELNSNEGLDISIKNIQGQEVYHSFNNTLDRIQVNLDKPAKGLYFLHLQNERGVITKKIVLQ